MVACRSLTSHFDSHRLAARQSRPTLPRAEAGVRLTSASYQAPPSSTLRDPRCCTARPLSLPSTTASDYNRHNSVARHRAWDP